MMTSTRRTTRTHPVARCDGDCDWCGEKIARGSRYVKLSGVVPELYVTSMHAECWVAAHDAPDYVQLEPPRGQYARGTVNPRTQGDPHGP